MKMDNALEQVLCILFYYIQTQIKIKKSTLFIKHEKSKLKSDQVITDAIYKGKTCNIQLK